MANTEREVTIYARIGNTNGLDEADATEQHEQWEMSLPGEVKRRIRIRETIKEGNSVYEETMKIDLPVEAAIHSVEEVETPITQDYFQAWKKHFGERGVLKTRYTFNAKDATVTIGGEEISIPGVKFEVDVFRKADGQRSRWCKIDVEIDKILDFLKGRGIDFSDVATKIKVSHLPFAPENAFVHGDGNEEHQTAVDAFWKAFRLEKEGTDGS